MRASIPLPPSSPSLTAAPLLARNDSFSPNSIPIQPKGDSHSSDWQAYWQEFEQIYHWRRHRVHHRKRRLSGKMYRLVDIVLKTIEDGSVRPQGVVATTFTVAAANELRERLASKSTKPADTRTRSSLAPA
jgi:hypothetical protein